MGDILDRRSVWLRENGECGILHIIFRLENVLTFLAMTRHDSWSIDVFPGGFPLNSSTLLYFSFFGRMFIRSRDNALHASNVLITICKCFNSTMRHNSWMLQTLLKCHTPAFPSVANWELEHFPSVSNTKKVLQQSVINVLLSYNKSKHLFSLIFKTKRKKFRILRQLLLIWKCPNFGGMSGFPSDLLLREQGL